MNQIAKLAVVGVLFASAGMGWAQQTSAKKEEPRPPLEDYIGKVQYSILACDLSYRLETSTRQLGDEVPEEKTLGACVKEQTADVKKALDRALPTIKKDRAKQAARDLHVAFLTALRGISPGVNETRLGYSVRQQQLRDKLNEAIARLETEI